MRIQAYLTAAAMNLKRLATPLLALLLIIMRVPRRVGNPSFTARGAIA